MERGLLRPGVASAAALAVLALLSGCGTTPEPTVPPPTQTPWVVVVTATGGAQVTAEAQPTAVAQRASPTPVPTRRATATSTGTAATPRVTEPTGTMPATATASAEAPSPTPQPTDTPNPTNFKYPPPVLSEPPIDQLVSWNGTVLLKWISVGELAEDEYYHLHLERRPRTAQEPWYGDYVYTRDTQFLAERAFLAPFHPSEEHGQGVVSWWVRVVRKTGEDTNGKPIGVDISPSSEERTLIVDPKPEG